MKCLDKKIYTRRKDADADVLRFGVAPYRCNECFRWHTTSKSPQKAKRYLRILLLRKLRARIKTLEKIGVGKDPARREIIGDEDC